MPKRLAGIVCLMSALLATPASAEQRIISPADLQQAMREQAERDDTRRALVGAVLRDDRVRELAATLSLDLTRAEEAVATLTEDDLEAAASAASAMQQELAGEASTVTISTTTLLLIIIIVILLVN